MIGLAAVLAGRREPGIYRWRAAFAVADVHHAVEHADWSFAYLDGWAGPDARADAGGGGDDPKAEFLAAIGEALGFPDYYGHNFDALADCLDDVRAGDHRGTLLLWEGWAVLARRDAHAFSVALTVLGGRVYDERGDPFCVVLRGDGPDQPGVDDLD